VGWVLLSPTGRHAYGGYRAAVLRRPFTFGDGTCHLHADAADHGKGPVPAITAARPDVQMRPERLARNSLASSSAARWSAGRVRWAYTLSVIAPPAA
jgi:hypothetical protein